MLKLFSIFIFLFLKGGNFTVVDTVSVIFSCGNFSRDIVGLETDEKQILLCEAVDHSFKLVNLDFFSILTGTIETKWFAWNLLLFILWSFVIPDLQNKILMFGWLVTDSPIEWMILLNKFLKSFSLESWYNEQIFLLHTEDRARMHKKDAQDISTQVLMVSFLTCSHKGNQNSACSMKPKT